MSDESRQDRIDRRRVLQATGTAVSGGLMLGATGTAAASGKKNQQSGGKHDHGIGKGQTEGGSSVEVISTDGDTVVTLVEVFGEKFLFKEAAAYRNADGVSAQSDDTTYEATKSGYPLEFQKVDSSVSANDIGSDGSIQTKGMQAQAVDITPENYIEDYDVDVKQISSSCGDLVFSSHHALEFHLQGGGAFSAIGVAGLAGVLCYVAGASASIPTGGASGLLAAGACSMVTAAVDQLIDVEMIPNTVALSVNFWDEDEEYPFGINTSPTVAVGLAPGWEVQWHESPKIGEFDQNIHLGI